MLWYCEYTWFSGTTRQQVATRIVEMHDAGATHPDQIKGWYQLAGGGAGFMLVDARDPRELTQMLQPYMDLMSWDVRAIYELPYQQTIDELRQAAGS